MTVLIDDRAGSQNLVKYPPLDSIGSLCRLSSADACFTGNGPSSSTLIGIELKSTFDLVSSSQTARLQASQIPAMLEEYDISYLLHYGVYKPGPDGSLQILRGRSWVPYAIGNRPIPYGFIESLLLTLSGVGIRVKRVNSIEEAAAWIGCAYRWWSKPWTDHKGMRALDKTDDMSLMPTMSDATRRRANIARSFPGVGYERAVAIANRFRSPRDLVNASAEQLQLIDGVGKVIAKEFARAASEVEP